jgi:MAF protein
MRGAVSIAGRLIGRDHAPFVVAEMSGNHNRSLERALRIVEAAAKSGAHGLKIQTYTPDTMTLDLDEREFHVGDPSSLWAGTSLYRLYEAASTPWEWHKPIFDLARKLGLIAFSTPFDASAVACLEDLDVPCYKIASFENTDLPLIRLVAATGKPLLMSTGMATVAELDESVLPGEQAAEHVVRLAAKKAAVVAALLSGRGLDALVLAADTTVALDGAILGKPGDAAEALEMLRRLAGARHEVLTACRLVRTDDGRVAASLTVSGVRFGPWNESLARWYVGTGEPMDKAGAYGIQGKGVLLTSGIDGSWSNVVGLPLEELASLFRGVGDDLLMRVEGRNTG